MWLQQRLKFQTWIHFLGPLVLGCNFGFRQVVTYTFLLERYNLKVVGEMRFAVVSFPENLVVKAAYMGGSWGSS